MIKVFKETSIFFFEQVYEIFSEMGFDLVSFLDPCTFLILYGINVISSPADDGG